MGALRLSGHIVVPPEDLDAVLAELPIHIQLTREEPGCRAFSVRQSPTDSRRFDVAEEFVDREAFEMHQRRVRASRWGDITRNVTRHYEITELAG
ncbi:MAG: antibiotic biosynthesis monooxygenase [Pseudomonadales bacterium]|nr:antibiotic biosynthesis monooxygenase [Pseudomonadales bacterium]MCP5184511.1 antibiotic biosynthesis monooxygenase [Pseudomonadales bacterium]